MTIDDLKIGHVYRSKKPKMVGVFDPLVDDRQILYISGSKTIVEKGKEAYSPEFEAWCKEKSNRNTYSFYDQERFEKETGKDVKVMVGTVWDFNIQYDSPSVKMGKKHPFISFNKFLKWMDKDVTEIIPKGEWAKSI